MKKILLLIGFVWLTGAVRAGYPVSLFTTRTAADPVVLGEWNTGIEKCLRYGQENHVPVFIVWSEKGCGFCNDYGNALLSQAFKDWMKTKLGSSIVLCYCMGQEKSSSVGAPDYWRSTTYYWLRNGKKNGYPLTAGDSFAWNGANLQQFPYVEFYWRSDKPENCIDVHMTGNGGTVIADLERYFGKYEPSSSPAYQGGDFLVGESKYDRMEVEMGDTKTLTVQFARTNAVEYVYTNRLYVSYKGASLGVKDVVWTAGTMVTNVAVSVPAGLAGGEKLDLVLCDAAGQGVSTNSAVCTVNANSAGNPHWIGERTLAGTSALEFGEWTMDLELATNFTAKAVRERTVDKAYTMVLFTGAIWCPYCKGLEDQFLSTDWFKNTAKNRHISLVTLENPKRSPDANPTVPNGPPPSLLKYEKGTADTKTSRQASGAAYLTRHNVDLGQAGQVLQRNHTLGYKSVNDTPSGFKPFDSARTGYPTIALLNKDGALVGYCASTCAGATYTLPADKDGLVKGDTAYAYDVEAMKKRFTELLDMADRGTTVHHARPETTRQVMRSGETVTGRLCADDLKDAWRVTGAARRVRASVRSDRDGAASLSFYAYDEEYGFYEYATSEGTGSLAAGVAESVAVEGGDVWVMVRGSATTNAPATFAPRSHADSTCPYQLTVRDVFVPVRAAVTNELDALLAEILMFIEAEKVYYLEGAAIPKDSKVFVKADPEKDDNFYRALVSGDVEVPLSIPEGAKAGDVKKFVCYIDEAVQIGFESSSATYPEGCGMATFNVIRRDDGTGARGEVVGRVEVKTSVDRSDPAYADYADPRRYEFGPEWTMEVLEGGVTNWFCEVKWADGDGLAKPVSFKVFDDDIAFGTQWLDFTLRVTGGARATVADNAGEFVAILSDDDIANIGVLAFTQAVPAFSRTMQVVLKEGEDLYLVVSRLYGSDGYVSAQLKMQCGGDVRLGEFMEWESNDVPLRFPIISGAEIVSFCKGATEFTVTLVPQNGIGALPGASVVSVKLVPGDAPYCRDYAEWLLQDDLQFTSLCRDYHLSDPSLGAETGGAKVQSVEFAVDKTTGSLPPGVTAEVVGDVFRLSGVPSQTGDHSAVFRVSSVRRYDDGTEKTVQGATFPVDFHVVSGADAAKESGGEIPSFDESRVFTGVPVVSPAMENPDNVSGMLIGMLDVTLPTSGRASAKLVCTNGTFAYSTSSWTTAGDGRLTALLVSDRAAEAFSGSSGTMAVSVVTGDTFEAVLDFGHAGTQTVALANHDWDTSRWVGTYTVQMPQATNSLTAAGVEFAYPASGDASLSLRLVEKAGTRVIYAGTLPNGRAVSGSVPLVPPSGLAVKAPAMLPVFCHADGASGYTFAGGLYIAPDGEDELDNEKQSVVSSVELQPYWLRSDTVTRLNWLNAYGAFFAPDRLTELHEGAYSVDVFFNIEIANFATDLGAVVDWIGAGVSLVDNEVRIVGRNPNNITLAYDRNSGMVSGTFDLKFEKGGVRSVSYRGALLPGWPSLAVCSDCGDIGAAPRRVMSGSCWFTEKWNGKRISNGCGVFIDRDPVKE